MKQIRSSRLQTALRTKQQIRFWRPFEDGSVHGYVVDIGPRWFMVALVGDGLRFNGFQCFRQSDVRDLEVPHAHAAFAEAALKKRGQRMPKKPRVAMSGIEELLRSASKAFPLVTIRRELIDADVCLIGRVIDIAAGHLLLLNLDADAKWDPAPSKYQLTQITRVDFGGDYEEALHLVGGEPELT